MEDFWAICYLTGNLGKPFLAFASFKPEKLGYFECRYNISYFDGKSLLSENLFPECNVKSQAQYVKMEHPFATFKHYYILSFFVLTWKIDGCVKSHNMMKRSTKISCSSDFPLLLSQFVKFWGLLRLHSWKT